MLDQQLGPGGKQWFLSRNLISVVTPVPDLRPSGECPAQIIGEGKGCNQGTGRTEVEQVETR